MLSERSYKVMLKDNFFRKLVRQLARKCGYICIPKEYPSWAESTASTNNIIATKINQGRYTYMVGQNVGKAEAYTTVSEELKNFGKY